MLCWTTELPMFCLCVGLIFCFVTFINSLTVYPRAGPSAPTCRDLCISPSPPRRSPPSAPAWVYLLPSPNSWWCSLSARACTVFANDLFEPAIWGQWNKLMEAWGPKHALATVWVPTQWEVFRLSGSQRQRVRQKQTVRQPHVTTLRTCIGPPCECQHWEVFRLPLTKTNWKTKTKTKPFRKHDMASKV